LDFEEGSIEGDRYILICIHLRSFMAVIEY